MVTYKEYIDDVKAVSDLPIEWDKLNGKNILITGATGLIGSCLVDVLGYRNKTGRTLCNIYAMSRSGNRLQRRFPEFFKEKWFIPVVQDIRKPLLVETDMDFIVNCASNAHPRIYAEDPVGTITTNLVGLENLLHHAVACNTEKVLEVSSIEIYGACNTSKDDFKENYCGYLDCNTLRAGYPESKRVCEALCQAYRSKYKLPIVIARPCRVYGPTMDMSDSKATAQFFKNVLAGENIVLKSKGDQVFSYAYMADVVAGLLYLLFRGEDGQAYNIADPNSTVSLRNLAELIAKDSGQKVVFDSPDDIEKRGFSGATRGVLITTKIERLGWRAQTNIEAGVQRTVEILSQYSYIEGD